MCKKKLNVVPVKILTELDMGLIHALVGSRVSIITAQCYTERGDATIRRLSVRPSVCP